MHGKQMLRDGNVRFSAQLLLKGWQLRILPKRQWLTALPTPALGFLDRLSPVRCSWASGNASTFRKHILAVNGFDNTTAYGSEDKEFGVRLRNFGIKGRHLRYFAPLYHLEHSRGYVDPFTVKRDRDIVLNSRAAGRINCEDGINP